MQPSFQFDNSMVKDLEAFDRGSSRILNEKSYIHEKANENLRYSSERRSLNVV